MECEGKKDCHIGLFYNLDEEFVSGFIKDLKRLYYKKGESMLMEETDGNSLYHILSGKVQINKGLPCPEASYAPLSLLCAGDFFGEMSLMDNEPRSATVVALEDVELVEIPREKFFTFTPNHAAMMTNLIRTLSHRLRMTNERVSGLMGEIIRENRLTAIGMTASKIIHDIKTPLTVIVLSAQMIEELYPESAEHTENIVKHAKMVDELVRETLDYVRGTPTPLMIRKIDLEIFLRDLKDTYGASFKGRDIDFIVENKCNEPVYFDENRIRRVIINLLRNSAEAIKNEGEIRIVTSLASNWLQISVIDNGAGIPEHIVPELFKPFVTHDKPTGTGLGLPICAKLVQEHAGRLDFKPVEPHGSRFDIRIPQNLD